MWSHELAYDLLHNQLQHNIYQNKQHKWISGKTSIVVTLSKPATAEKSKGFVGIPVPGAGAALLCPDCVSIELDPDVLSAGPLFPSEIHENKDQSFKNQTILL